MKEKITLLYVDDEPINRMLFEANLKKYFIILTAASGKDGLEILNVNTDIKVVVSDMKMPFMSGIEFIKEARKIFPDLTYFILTGFDLNDEINNALENKVINKYLQKPFNIEVLINSINEATK